MEAKKLHNGISNYMCSEMHIGLGSINKNNSGCVIIASKSSHVTIVNWEFRMLGGGLTWLI